MKTWLWGIVAALGVSSVALADTPFGGSNPPPLVPLPDGGVFATKADVTMPDGGPVKSAIPANFFAPDAGWQSLLTAGSMTALDGLTVAGLDGGALLVVGPRPDGGYLLRVKESGSHDITASGNFTLVGDFSFQVVGQSVEGAAFGCQGPGCYLFVQSADTNFIEARDAGFYFSNSAFFDGTLSATAIVGTRLAVDGFCVGTLSTVGGAEECGSVTLPAAAVSESIEGYAEAGGIGAGTYTLQIIDKSNADAVICASSAANCTATGAVGRLTCSVAVTSGHRVAPRVSAGCTTNPAVQINGYVTF